jgi:hypothetical protein
MFHDMGLTHRHSSTQERFQVDSANVARDFLANVKAKTVANQFAEALAAAGVKRGTSLRESKSPRPSQVWS